MVRLSSLIVGLVLACAVARAKDVQLLDLNALGQPTSQAVRFLSDKQPDDIEPYMVTTDVEQGHYAGASVYYGQAASTSEVRAALMKRYAQWVRPTSGEPLLWRVMGADGTVRFVIQLAEEKDGPFVIYLRPASYSKERRSKALLRSLVGESDCIPAAEETPASK